MPNLLPFSAFYSTGEAVYIPGEEAPRLVDRGTLVAYPGPALFVYHQRFGDEVRYGVTGLLNRSEASVFLHEETFPNAVASCVKSIDKAQTDPGSLWFWCRDKARTLEPLLQPPRDPFHEVTDRLGVLHQIWPITDPARIDSLQTALQGRELFLADGHHRFAAGWNVATIQIRNPALRTRGPVSVDEIERNARDGILLPQKSTDFYPKLAAGLVIRS